MAAKRRTPAGGVGSNQYQTVGTSRARAASGRVACFAGTLDAVDATDQFVAGLVEHEGHRCEHCQQMFDPGDEGAATYECDNCGTFVGDEGNKCPSCNRFARKASDASCPHCNEGLDDLGEPVTVWQHPDEPEVTFASIDEARAWDADREAREAARVARAEIAAQAERELEDETEAEEAAAYESFAPFRNATPDQLARVPESVREFITQSERAQRRDARGAILMVRPNEALSMVGVAPISLVDDQDDYLPRDEMRVICQAAYADYQARCTELGLPDLFAPHGANAWRALENARIEPVRADLLTHAVRALGD